MPLTLIGFLIFVLKAFVVVTPGTMLTAEAVRTHCQRELTKYKVPRVIEFRADLPRSIIGKVLRRVLVEEDKARTGSPEVSH